MKNGEVVATTPDLSKFDKTQIICFDFFDVEKDIIDFRSTGNNGREISINLINKGVTTQLFFGPNSNEPWIYIDDNLIQCTSNGPEDEESTNILTVQNGIIIQSACKGRDLTQIT